VNKVVTACGIIIYTIIFRVIPAGKPNKLTERCGFKIAEETIDCIEYRLYSCICTLLITSAAYNNSRWKNGKGNSKENWYGKELVRENGCHFPKSEAAVDKKA